MSITRSTYRTAIAALVCALLVSAAPAAADPPADMHASVAQASADARQQQDLRAPDTQRTQDLNGLGDGSYAPGTYAIQRPSPGQPTWPVDPQPINPAPAVHAVSESDGGIGWLTIALGLAGGLLAIGGIVAIAVHARRLGRVHISA